MVQDGPCFHVISEKVTVFFPSALASFLPPSFCLLSLLSVRSFLLPFIHSFLPFLLPFLPPFLPSSVPPVPSFLPGLPVVATAALVRSAILVSLIVLHEPLARDARCCLDRSKTQSKDSSLLGPRPPTVKGRAQIRATHVAQICHRPVTDMSVCPSIGLPVDLLQRDGGSFDGRLLPGAGIVD